ncbi:damage-control phosphatase ARMT1-like isoform X2 [Anneissia japonica]|nr:damage-control phosphatase ARMT1-like isoform X2 [Anneissia japonica]
MQTNKYILEIEDGNKDVSIWKQVLKEETERNEGEAPKFFKAAWLYTECYMYRKIMESIALSCHLKEFDPFGEQKRNALYDCLKPASLLIQYLHDSIEAKKNPNDMLSEFIQMSLWGNKCDLSISAGVENSQKVSPLCQLQELKSKILINKTGLVWDELKQAKSIGSVRIDFILDNAGYEFLSDLCLAECLTRLNLVDDIHFHCKAMPWFVSDVTPVDFAWTLDVLGGNENQGLSNLSKSIRQKLEDKSWSMESHKFWTTPHSFASMETVSPELYRDLTKSNLLIFKGDLNYRKLVLDRDWEHTVPFKEALHGFHPTALCALRTSKADLIVGLSEGLAQKLEAQHPGWMVSGEYAVIEFCEKMS